MKTENISDALDMLDENILNSVSSARTAERKRFGVSKVGVIAAAAAIMVCGATAAAAVSGGHFSDIKNMFGTVVGTEYLDATDDLTVEFIGFKDGSPDVAVNVVDDKKAPFSELNRGATISLANYNITDESGNVIFEATSNKSAEVDARQPAVTTYSGASIVYPAELDIRFSFPPAEVPDGYIETDEFQDTFITLRGENHEEGWVKEEVILCHSRCYLHPETGEKIFIPYDTETLSRGTYTINIESFMIESKGDQPLEVHGHWETEFTV